MSKTGTVLGVCMAAVLASGTAGGAQTASAVERLTFMVPNADKAGPSGKGRMELVITQWSNEADRARIFDALERGELADAIWRSPLVGYMYWPGNLEYSIRYAYKATGPNGEDVILATDRPVSRFWDAAEPPAKLSGYTVIQLHVDRMGHGEAKLGTTVHPDMSTKTFMLDKAAAQPTLMTDVRLEGTVAAADAHGSTGVPSGGRAARSEFPTQVLVGCLRPTAVTGRFQLAEAMAMNDGRSTPSGEHGMRAYTITGVVPPGTKLETHVNHKVELTGFVQDDGMFEIQRLKMISATCP